MWEISGTLAVGIYRFKYLITILFLCFFIPSYNFSTIFPHRISSFIVLWSLCSHWRFSIPLPYFSVTVLWTSLAVNFHLFVLYAHAKIFTFPAPNTTFFSCHQSTVSFRILLSIVWRKHPHESTSADWNCTVSSFYMHNFASQGNMLTIPKITLHLSHLVTFYEFYIKHFWCSGLLTPSFGWSSTITTSKSLGP